MSEFLIADLSERFAVMLRQERTIYRCDDYLSPHHHTAQQTEGENEQRARPGDLSSVISGSGASSSSTSNGLNEIWREKICEWSYQVIDHFDFNREVVSVSLSYLDRFLSSRPVNKKIFQLAAMTTLYLSIKLYEPATLKIKSLIELSRGYFMVEHVAAMEEAILRALSWHVHPPTPLCLVRHFLLLLPASSCDPHVKHDIMEMSRFLTELSVCDYFFVTKKPSSVALASVLIAMNVHLESGLSAQARTRFVERVYDVSGVSHSSDEVEECRARLREMYYQGGYEQQHQEHRALQSDSKNVDTDDTVRGVSPVCVSSVVDAERASNQTTGHSF